MLESAFGNIPEPWDDAVSGMYFWNVFLEHAPCLKADTFLLRWISCTLFCLPVRMEGFSKWAFKIGFSSRLLHIKTVKFLSTFLKART